jgi:succinate-semialdehyde dehydrogenase/glutarate-semialdehyde dehydrogenase
MLRSLSPFDGSLVAEHPTLTDAELEAAVALAADQWRIVRRFGSDDLSGRRRALERLSDELAADLPELATMAAREMGRPYAQAAEEMKKCVQACRLVASRLEGWLAPELVTSAGPYASIASATVTPRPLGLVLSILPWNFPYWQPIRALLGALAAGNCVLLKHDEHLPGCARLLAERIARAGLDCLVTWLPIDRAQTARLISDPRIAAVTFTGSTRAGRIVAATAGAALKPSLLELGGSDPFLVLEGADLRAAAKAAVRSRLINNGQSCVAAKRFIVLDALHDPFVELLCEELAKVRIGDPLDPATELGPLARPDLAETLRDQVARTVAAGASVAFELPVPHGPCWAPATILTETRQGHPVFLEETFGPLFAVARATETRHALWLANASPFALGASVWGQLEPFELSNLLAALRVGTVALNDIVRSYPELPFGGRGDSGWGSELGREGIRALTFPQVVTGRAD